MGGRTHRSAEDLRDVREDIDFLTERLSTQVRTIALGLLALSWGLLVPGSETVVTQAWTKRWLLLVGGLAVLTMFLDFLQYLAGYLDAETLLKTIGRGDGPPKSDGSTTGFARRRAFLFWAKQMVLAVSVFVFLIVIGSYFILL